MSLELINRITIKKDGVYVSTHSINDTSPYHSVKVDFLTKAYNMNGQKGLDKEFIDFLLENGELRGNHKSIMPYKNAMYKIMYDKEFIKIKNQYFELSQKAFYVANRFDEYKNLSKDKTAEIYEELKPKVKKLRNLRNEYVANIVENERLKILVCEEQTKVYEPETEDEENMNFNDIEEEEL